MCYLLIYLKILFAHVCGYWPCVFICRDSFMKASHCFVLPCNVFLYLSNDFFYDFKFIISINFVVLYKTMIFFFY